MKNNLDVNWIKNLVTAIDQQVLINLIPDQGQRQKYFTAEHIAIWVRAFTNENISPNVNGQVFEYYGDRLMSAELPRFFIDKFPGLNENEYTQLDNHFKSKSVHETFMQALKLASYYRSSEDISLNAKRASDVFESFVGALGTIAGRVETKVNGVPIGQYVMTRKLIEYLFNHDLVLIETIKVLPDGSTRTQKVKMFSDDFDVREFSLQPPKTFCLQFFKKVELPMTTDKKNKGHTEGGAQVFQDGGRYVVKITIGPKQIKFLNERMSSQFEQIPSGKGSYIIGSAETTNIKSGYSKNITTDTAWLQARTFLYKRGFTEKFADEVTQRIIRNDPHIKTVYEAANNICNNLYGDVGYVNESLQIQRMKVIKPREAFLLTITIEQGIQQSIFYYEDPDRTEEGRVPKGIKYGYMKTLEEFVGVYEAEEQVTVKKTPKESKGIKAAELTSKPTHPLRSGKSGISESRGSISSVLKGGVKPKASKPLFVQKTRDLNFEEASDDESSSSVSTIKRGQEGQVPGKIPTPTKTKLRRQQEVEEDEEPTRPPGKGKPQPQTEEEIESEPEEEPEPRIQKRPAIESPPKAKTRKEVVSPKLKVSSKRTGVTDEADEPEAPPKTSKRRPAEKETRTKVPTPKHKGRRVVEEEEED